MQCQSHIALSDLLSESKWLAEGVAVRNETRIDAQQIYHIALLASNESELGQTEKATCRDALQRMRERNRYDLDDGISDSITRMQDALDKLAG